MLKGNTLSFFTCIGFVSYPKLDAGAVNNSGVIVQ